MSFAGVQIIDAQGDVSLLARELVLKIESDLIDIRPEQLGRDIEKTDLEIWEVLEDLMLFIPPESFNNEPRTNFQADAHDLPPYILLVNSES